jgi:disulfide bond formation protein DsbB
MDRMRQVAFQTVQRACMFGALAIFCLMVGLSDDLKLAFKAGGTVTILMAGILIYKAREARTKPYRKTEMWLHLPKHYRPPDEYAQWASATVLRETYLNFAFWTSAAAVAMWMLALVISVAGHVGADPAINMRPY